MTGSAKQIAWAESIINDARETIRRNIERCERQPLGVITGVSEADVWRKVSEIYEDGIAHATSASQIIDNRRNLDGARVRWMFSQICTMLSNGRTLDEIR